MEFRENATIVLIFCIYVELCCSSGLGRCPRYEFIKNFNITKIAGHWYEIERTFNLIQLSGGCTILSLKGNAKGQFEVTIKSFSRWSGNVQIDEGIATPSRKHPSILLYRISSEFPTAIAKYLPGAGFYQILDTDYDNFAILLSCTNLGLVHTDRIWVLSREKEIDVLLRAKIYDILKTKRIDSDRLVLPKNGNCTDS